MTNHPQQQNSSSKQHLINNNTNNNINSLLISAMSNLTSNLAASNNASSTGDTASSAASNDNGSTTTTAAATVAAASMLNAADLIICKLVAPYHIINDPRLLECGHSACANCIVSLGKQHQAVKCPYCQLAHKLPTDPAKLIVNRNLQTFLKLNLAQMNQNFTKQLEDSMFALER